MSYGSFKNDIVNKLFADKSYTYEENLGLNNPEKMLC